VSDDVAGCLAAWLRERGIEAHVEAEARATVGLSQETWLVRIGDADAVLRLPTPASGRRSILTQIAALQAVAGSGVPAPALLWHDETADNPFGRPFLVMARAGGVVPVGWHDLPEPRRTRLAEQAVDILVALQRIDVSRTPLGGAGSPLMELDGLRRLLERVAPLPKPVTVALWWLDRHRPPPPERPVLVHGDYRMGNFVVEAERITGVLDWEMAGSGDPLVDVAFCFIPVWEPPGVDEARLVARYAEQSGVDVDPDRLHWHRALAFVRLAYYALAGARAFDDGRSDDLRLAALRLQLPVTVDRLAATLSGTPIT
jgi:aminoglycoside phosphotransferase (APT) family kinase protein